MSARAPGAVHLNAEASVSTFLSIMLYAGFILTGLTVLAISFTLLAKLLQDNTVDPDAGH